MTASRDLDLETKMVVPEEWLILPIRIAAEAVVGRLEQYFVVQTVRE